MKPIETDFVRGKWDKEVNVRDFIQRNYTPYDGDESFLEGPTSATSQLWSELQALQKEERANKGVLDMETDVVSSITAYPAAYMDKSLEKIVGLQTDKPLKRAFMPYGGIRMSEEACTTYGYKPSDKLHEIFTKYHKTHNKYATISMYNFSQSKGVVEVSSDGFIEAFREKSDMDGDLINIGFMVLEPEVFNYIHGDEPLEYEPMNRLVEDKQLMGYVHKGYWQCMDTLREKQKIELKKRIVVYMELIDIMMLKTYDYKRKNQNVPKT